MHVLQPFLPGKYVEKGERPFGPRQFLFTDGRIRDIQVGRREGVWGIHTGHAMLKIKSGARAPLDLYFFFHDADTYILSLSHHHVRSLRIFSRNAQPLLSVMKAISEERGKTLAQVGGGGRRGEGGGRGEEGDLVAC